MIIDKTINIIIIEDFLKNIEKIISLIRDKDLLELYENIQNTLYHFSTIVNEKCIKDEFTKINLMIKSIKKANVFLQKHIMKTNLNNLFNIICSVLGANILISNVPKMIKMPLKTEEEEITPVHIYDTFEMFGEINYVYKLSYDKYFIWFIFNNSAINCAKRIDGNIIGNNIVNVKYLGL